MSDPFVAEIRIFPYNFAPRGWARCDGQLVPISQNTALFSLLGTTYGGDGRTTFALPNLSGSMAMGSGQGSGLSQRELGESGGSDAVTLGVSELPAHSHPVAVSAADGADRSPAGNLFANDTGGLNSYAVSAGPATLAPDAVGATGGSAPHSNLQPYLALEFCIALEGVYPPRP